jgi:hypothetical protein
VSPVSGPKCLWAQDQNGLHVFACLQLAQDQASLDRLTHSDLVCNQEPWPIGADKLEDWAKLIRHVVNARRMERIKSLRFQDVAGTEQSGAREIPRAGPWPPLQPAQWPS